MAAECQKLIMKKFAKPLARPNKSTEELLNLISYLKVNRHKLLSDAKECKALVGKSDDAVSFLFSAYATEGTEFFEADVILALKVFTGLLALIVLFCFYLALFEPRDEDEFFCQGSFPELDTAANSTVTKRKTLKSLKNSND